MRISHRLSIILISLLFSLSACDQFGVRPDRVSPQEATQTARAFDAMVKATLDALASQASEPPGPPVDTATPPATPSATAPPPTATASMTMTPSKPVAFLSENTHCRSGPGKVYDLRYTAMADTQMDVISLSTLNDYVVVQIPDKPGQYCWLWTRYAELRGDLSGLIKSTPPPSPTPVITFDVVYDYMDGCVGWDPAFKVTNTGSVTFKSYYVKVLDTVTSMVQDHTGDNFDETQGCPIVQAIPQLDPGMTGWAHAYSYPYDPAGNPMEATIQLCTGPALGGTCVTRNVNFTP